VANLREALACCERQSSSLSVWTRDNSMVASLNFEFVLDGPRKFEFMRGRDRPPCSLSDVPKIENWFAHVLPS